MSNCSLAAGAEWRHNWLSSDLPLVPLHHMVAVNAGYMVLVWVLSATGAARNALPRPLQTAHNLAQSVFSAAALSVMVRELHDSGRLYDVQAMYCRRPTPTGTYAAVMYAFYLSKVAEMLDTVFLLSNGKAITLLHFYHHSTTLPLTWVAFAYDTPLDGVTMGLNLFVHTIMYTHFLLPCQSLRRMITTLQMAQFCAVLATAGAWSWSFGTAEPCQGDPHTVAAMSAVYAGYLVLFAKFYVQTYEGGLPEFCVRRVQPWLPDAAVRVAVRAYLAHSVRRLRRLDHPHKELRIVKRIKGGGMQQVAHRTDAANEQHYEVPTEFFHTHLGPLRKYSCCEWDPHNPHQTLRDAELATYRSYFEKLDMAALGPGASVLEVGCGWGSFILHAAATYPGVAFHGFSNSRTQIEYIRSTAAARGLENVRVAVLDVNDFCASGLPRSWPKLHDRAFSCECLEHSQDYGSVFRAVAQALKPDGLVFVHVLCHREYTYFMNGDDWMGRNFFTGGTIPSTKLFMFFNADLVVDDCWYLDGRHYARTADAWLKNLHANAGRALAVLGGRRAFEEWRAFYLFTSESFGMGDQWMVAYYVMRRRAVG